MQQQTSAREKRGLIRFFSFGTGFGALLLVPLAYLLAIFIRFLLSFSS